jgi:hypothetical protein
MRRRSRRGSRVGDTESRPRPRLTRLPTSKTIRQQVEEVSVMRVAQEKCGPRAFCFGCQIKVRNACHHQEGKVWAHLSPCQQVGTICGHKPGLRWARVRNALKTYPGRFSESHGWLPSKRSLGLLQAQHLHWVKTRLNRACAGFGQTKNKPRARKLGTSRFRRLAYRSEALPHATRSTPL